MSGKRGVMNAIFYKLLKKNHVYHGYVLLSFVFVVFEDCCFC